MMSSRNVEQNLQNMGVFADAAPLPGAGAPAVGGYYAGQPGAGYYGQSAPAQNVQKPPKAIEDYFHVNLILCLACPWVLPCGIAGLAKSIQVRHRRDDGDNMNVWQARTFATAAKRRAIVTAVLGTLMLAAIIVTLVFLFSYHII